MNNFTLKEQLDERFNEVRELFELIENFSDEHRDILSQLTTQRDHFARFDAPAKIDDIANTDPQKKSLFGSLRAKYESLNTNLRDQYVLDYFESTQQNLWRCPVCGKVLDTKKKADPSLSQDFALKIELDHLIPKDKFPQYALSLENLIPICHECNHNKSAGFGFESPKECFDMLKEHQFLSFGRHSLTPLQKCNQKKKNVSGSKHSFTFTSIQVYRNLTVNSLFWKDLGRYNQGVKYEGMTIFENMKLPRDQKIYDWLSSYGLPKRMEHIAHSCIESLLQQLRHLHLSGPENLWQHLEYLAHSNFEEFKTGFPTHPYIQVWQDLLDWCLSSPHHVTSLWEEVSQRTYAR